jgi:hypothetical protein
MALVKCKECQKEISSTASSCPQCGAPAKMQRSSLVRRAILTALLALFGSIAVMSFILRNGPALADKIVGDVVIANRYDTMQDGHSLSWKLEPGMYRVELTANGDGVIVDWVAAANCPKATTQTQTYSGVCELPGTGQLVITNPTLFGLGQASNVSLKITRLAR